MIYCIRDNNSIIFPFLPWIWLQKSKICFSTWDNKEVRSDYSKATKELLRDANHTMSLVDLYQPRGQIIHHFSTNRLGETEQNIIVKVSETIVYDLVTIFIGGFNEIHSGQRGYSFTFLGQPLVEKNVAFAQVVHLHYWTDHLLTVGIH